MQEIEHPLCSADTPPTASWRTLLLLVTKQHSHLLFAKIIYNIIASKNYVAFKKYV